MGTSENRNLFSVITHAYIKMIYIGFIRGIDCSSFYDFAIRFANYVGAIFCFSFYSWVQNPIWRWSTSSGLYANFNMSMEL